MYDTYANTFSGRSILSTTDLPIVPLNYLLGSERAKILLHNEAINFSC